MKRRGHLGRSGCQGARATHGRVGQSVDAWIRAEEVVKGPVLLDDEDEVLNFAAWGRGGEERRQEARDREQEQDGNGRYHAESTLLQLRPAVDFGLENLSVGRKPSSFMVSGAKAYLGS